MSKPGKLISDEQWSCLVCAWSGPWFRGMNAERDREAARARRHVKAKRHAVRRVTITMTMDPPGR